MIGGDNIAAQRERLLADAWPIERNRGYVDSPHGLRRATFYRLTGPRLQRDLFE